MPTHLVVLACLFVAIGAAPAHAGKVLTTGMSGFNADSAECAAVNVSAKKTLVAEVRIRNGAGIVIGTVSGPLAPMARHRVGAVGPELWCEITVVSGGNTKHVRGNMTVYDGGVVAGMEAAR
jgi:hypothetical protein